MELIFINTRHTSKKIQDIFRYLRLNRKLINRDKINLNQILSL